MPAIWTFWHAVVTHTNVLDNVFDLDKKKVKW
jgi:hypothetical protein